MYTELKRNLKRHVANIPGWRTDRKIVVFESDDWGSVRVPSKKAVKCLKSKKLKYGTSSYNEIDTLENKEDLITLLEVLNKFQDSKGNNPIFTLNTVMCNPDFDKIENDKFNIYHNEHFFNSYKRFHNHDISKIWENGVNDGLIKPQFHAREHLNVSLWMNALKLKHNETRAAFDCGYYGLNTITPDVNQDNYLAAYWPLNENDFENKNKIIEDGLDIFEKTFGFRSESFVACKFVYPIKLEKRLVELGIEYVQTQRGRISPNIGRNSMKTLRHFTGQVSKYGVFYTVRNCYFEPALNQQMDWINKCLEDIRLSFKWRKPAVISTHRINYVGGISLKNRDQGIIKLTQLLTAMLKIWPDIEFLSSNELGRIIKNEL